MKKSKTTLLALVAVVALAVGASAAQYEVTNLSITNTVKANATTTANMGSTVTLTKYEDVGMILSFQMADACTSNMVVTLVRSLDGTTWETTPGITWGITANGNTSVVGYTNLSSSVIGAAGYLKVLNIQNPHATVDMTNAVMKVVKKPSRTG